MEFINSLVSRASLALADAAITLVPRAYASALDTFLFGTRSKLSLCDMILLAIILCFVLLMVFLGIAFAIPFYIDLKLILTASRNSSLQPPDNFYLRHGLRDIVAALSSISDSLETMRATEYVVEEESAPGDGYPLDEEEESVPGEGYVLGEVDEKSISEEESLSEEESISEEGSTFEKVEEESDPEESFVASEEDRVELEQEIYDLHWSWRSLN